jgi:Ca2+-transporting ATPase
VCCLEFMHSPDCESVLGECMSHSAADGFYLTHTSVSTSVLEDNKTKALLQSRCMAASGLCVLAMVYGRTLDDLILAGLIGMEDPL